MTNRTVLGHHVAIRGDIVCDEDLLIEGNIISNKIDVKNHTLIIGKEAKVEGELHAAYVIIMGEVKGEVHASTRATLYDGAKLTGDMHTPRFQVGESAGFEGRIHYIRNAG